MYTQWCTQVMLVQCSQTLTVDAALMYSENAHTAVYPGDAHRLVYPHHVGIVYSVLIAVYTSVPAALYTDSVCMRGVL